MKADDEALMAAARRATEVLEEFEVRKRIDTGYTRIDAELIASASEVIVMYRKFERLLGGFLLEDGNPGIIVNWDRPRGLVHMTCAHELGHFALGHESTSDITVDVSKQAALIERTANQFAYALLAPSWLVSQTMRRQSWGRDSIRRPSIVYQMSLRLGMSYKAMVWSLNRLGHLSLNDALGIVDVQPSSLKRELLGGTTLSNPRSDVWMLTETDRDRILEPGMSDQIVFDLPNHASSGHIWSVDEAQSEGFLLKPFVRDARLMPAPRGSDVFVGGNGSTLRYELTTPSDIAAPWAIENGEVENYAADGDLVLRLNSRRRKISLSERAPWQPGRMPTGQLSLFAEFERVEDGFSQPERDRRLAGMRHV
ncbi:MULTISPECIES: ImmA/IrrE family metallo-endopeptidase [unclassified Delftia]|uniref:ImmA/IrrE family metallo-endopeptidase n=1 Tax=unclassified Delftia TaxID=2613839 RepID=UPI00190083E3|nr:MULTISPECIES: ImmA/IrrE family metallo-endopeptidase [unclassified Delftia]MBK0110966.1 ImmA/IrrE family metallo-endopeptidase [Delftia sp. S65]MBK0116284.1 ImmA/IrrE family metallo-endopeptidase [Delftia sp. S67]MBK0129800.1 ImmA/IrrE family metallo-endopeptidase [Delftia sp. S66]